MKTTKIDEIDYKILMGQLDLISYINEKIKNIEDEISKRALLDDDIKLLKTIPGIFRFYSLSYSRLCQLMSILPPKITNFKHKIVKIVSSFLCKFFYLFYRLTLPALINS